MFFSNLKSRQQYFLNDIEKFVRNGWLKSRNLSEEKKTPRAQIFRCFLTKVGTKSDLERASIFCGV